MRNISRAEDGTLEYEFNAVNGGDFESVTAADGQLLFRIADSDDLVPESYLVIVSRTRVCEFLADFSR